MPGVTPNHNRVIRHLCTALTLGVQGQAYEVFVADQRLWIPQPRLYTYPDVMIIQGDLVYQAGRSDTITNPIVIIEVLSRSTQNYAQNYDPGDKFAAYRRIPTFQEYWLIDQYSYHIESHTKTGPKRWVLQEYDGPDTTVEFTALGLAVALGDIYDKVQFEAANPDTMAAP